MLRFICRLAASVLLAAALLTPLVGLPVVGEGQPPSPQGTPTQADGGWRLMAQNNGLELHYHEATTEIAVREKGTGVWWYSNPPGREEDPLATGINKVGLQSQLSVWYTDESDQSFLINNYAGSINRGGVSMEPVEEGIRVTYDFPRENERFTIPVTYRLEGDRLLASVEASSIREYGVSRVVEIAFLPCFGAGGAQEEGYILLPDGSGAVMEFNNGKAALAPYSRAVYGRDPILSKMNDSPPAYDIRLPVFGIKRGGAACLAILQSGAAIATINAQVSGNTDSYNRVWPSFSYRLKDSAVLAEKDATAKSVSLYSTGAADKAPLTVAYCFLPPEEADYAGMARRTRAYLAETAGFEKRREGGYPLYATFYGGATRKESVWGIPLSVYKELTSYRALGDRVAELKERGIDAPVVAYKGWAAGGLKGKVPNKVRFESRLGGKKEFLALRDRLADQGIPFYPAADFTRLFRSGNGVNATFSTVKTVTRAPAYQYDYQLSTLTQKLEIKPWRLLRPEATERMMTSYLASARGYGLGLYSETVGRLVYADVGRRELFDRQRTARLHAALLKEAPDGAMLEDPNAYALGAARHVVGLAAGDSGFDMTDYAVPFYQMVLHGYVDYALEPSNTDGRDRAYLLRVLEYGASPQYLLTDRETEAFKDTEYQYLYATAFAGNIERMAADYAALCAVLEPLADQEMVSHRRLADGVFETEYADGTRVLVNYGDRETAAAGVTLGALDYAVVRGDAA